MENCDFCNAHISDEGGALIPDHAMQAAVRNGYDPRTSPQWTAMMQLALGLIKSPSPLSEQEISMRWRERISRGGRNWRICEHCFAAIQRFLPQRVEKQPLDQLYQNAPPKDALIGWVVPVACSPLSLLAGYLGLFSVLLFPAPIAVIVGILAVRDLRKNPQKQGWGRAIFALIAGGTMTLVILLLLGIILFARR